MQSFTIHTKAEEMQPITRTVAAAVEASGVREGLCTVFCPHTTAALTINENTDPDVPRDVLFALDAAFPNRPEFRHCEGNSAAHLKAGVLGASLCLPVSEGRLALGRWQGVFFCEFDGPRTRQFHVQVTGS